MAPVSGPHFPLKYADRRVWIPKTPDRIKTLEKPFIGTLLNVFWTTPRFAREPVPVPVDGCPDVFELSWKAWVPEMGRYVSGDELMKPKDVL